MHTSGDAGCDRQTVDSNKGPYVELYEFYVLYGCTYTIVLEMRQVDILALGALQQPFLPLLFFGMRPLGAPRQSAV